MNIFCILVFVSILRFSLSLDRLVGIVGGDETTIEENPWQVGLFNYNFKYGSPIFRNCGGSIINEQWVLSAAHCIVK